uniref:Uncharacterized protein n=1 Tax=Spongospora subterranea TaxID=70186 RepID=A0A0H5R656_9EUKA|eukprot:CRZ03714.1 hypothetical protein [Spongospora subterranea]
MVSSLWIWWSTIKPQRYALHSGVNALLVSLLVVLVAIVAWRRYNRLRPKLQRQQLQLEQPSTSWARELMTNQSAVCCISGQLITESTPLDINICQQLAKYCRLVIIAREHSLSDVQSILLNGGVISAGLSEHRILSCQTPLGYVAMVRHLNPELFLAGADDSDAVRLLRPYIRSILMVSRLQQEHNGFDSIVSALSSKPA